jgi:AcrR family transcriptional regulator
LLAEQGPAALTVRRLAERAGTSPSAVYGLFGDKGGLVEEMFHEGFRRLATRFAQIGHTDDPLADLRALGEAFRDNARANPHLYDLMFGHLFPQFDPAERIQTFAMATFQALVDAVQRCTDAGLLGGGEAMGIASILFAQVHGLASLELAGWLGPAEQADRVWQSALGVTMDGLRPRDGGG